MDDSGRMAAYIEDPSPQSLGRIEVFDYDTNEESWAPHSSFLVDEDLSFPRIDIDGDIILYWGQSTAPPGEAFLYYADSPTGVNWTLAGSLGATAFGSGLTTDACSCPNPPCTTLVSEPSLGFGSSGALLRLGGQVLAFVGDFSHDNTCYTQMDSDGGVWVFDVTPPAVGALVPSVVELLERQENPQVIQNGVARFGRDVNAAGSDDGGGYVIVGAPTAVGLTGASDGEAHLYRVDPSAAGPVFTREAIMESTMSSSLVGWRVRVADGWAFVSESSSLVSLRTVAWQRSSTGTWNNAQSFSDSLLSVDQEPMRLLLRDGSDMVSRKLVGGQWNEVPQLILDISIPNLPSANIAANASPQGAGFSLPPDGNIWVARFDCDGNLEDYIFGDERTTSIQAGSHGQVPTLNLRGSYFVSANDLSLISEGLPQTTTAVFSFSSNLLPFTVTSNWLASPLSRSYPAVSVVNGTASRKVDLDCLEGTPNCSAAMAGQSLYWQLAYRDFQAGVPTFRFSEAAGLVMQ